MKLQLGILLMIAGSASPSFGAVTIFDDESLFLADLTSPADFGSAPVNAHGAAQTAGLTAQTTTFSVNAKSYSFVFKEGIFDTTLGGTATVATGPSTVFSIDTAGSSFIYEPDPVDQGGASIDTWGYDTGSHINPGHGFNTVALFDFTGSATPVYSFSLQTADFEGGNAWSNVVAAYRTDGSLIGQISFDFPAPAYGDGTVEFIGFGADEALGYVAFFVGEDDATGTGDQEILAMGNFSLGTTVLESVPEPAAGLLCSMGVIAGLVGRRRGKA